MGRGGAGAGRGISVRSVEAQVRKGFYTWMMVSVFNATEPYT